MKIFRIGLPVYKKILKKLSYGKGYGKIKSIRKIMKFFDFLFLSDEVEVHGHKMYLAKGYEEYSTNGIYGILDTKAVESIIQPGDYTVDVGASIGYFTLIFARSVGKDGLVVAFEPKKDRFQLLTKNVDVNHYENIKLENKAILTKDTESKFFSRDDGFAGLRFIANPDKPVNYLDTYKHSTPIEVSSVDLDEYLKKLNIIEKISFIKIDVDGPELFVLQSSQLLLKNKNLKILIEWDKASAKWSGCDPSAILDILIDNNFKIFYPNYKENKFFQISKDELLEKPDILDETINLLCVKDSSILKKKGLL
jgi:FkbM family methyltransferase